MKMNEMIPFDFDGTPVRTVVIDGELHLVGKDVTERLGYANAAAAITRHCRGVQKYYPLQTPGGMQELRVLCESDVMRLIVGSKLPDAARFERWVFDEVLPAIRKTGGYMVAAPEETFEALAARVLGVLQDTVARQKAQIGELAPKANAYNRIALSEGSFCITEVAKTLQVRPKDLFAYLRTNEWIYKRGGGDLAYATRLKTLVLEHKITTVERSDGTEKTVTQVRVTPKGLTVLASLLGDGPTASVH